MYKYISIISIIITLFLYTSCITNKVTPPKTMLPPIPPTDTSQSNLALYQQAYAQAQQIYNTMTLQQRLAQLMIIRIHKLINTATAPEALTQILTELQPGGIILFSKNIQSTEQITQLIANMQSHSNIPLFISVDVEGG